MNYEKLGLRVGLEVHRQLDTRSKLFCNCSTTPVQKGPEIVFSRTLREAQSELGQVDPAALFETRRRRRIIYRAHTSDACLVEMDEEPPHLINEEAVRVALTVALMLDSTPVDEIHVMRKIVIDGSNTSGFQRTCIVAIGGRVSVDGMEVPIQTITLEEDAARIIEARRGEVVYDLSRLGIPLIEVSTAPIMSTPQLVAEVAYRIGRVLRATGKVKRGIGTVRQDLNISIEGGGLAEVKGVQELELIPKVVDYEARRQNHLRQVVESLKERGVKRVEVESQNAVDVTDIFANAGSKLIAGKIRAGGRVLALKLPGFAGLLKGAGDKDVRLGRELAEYAKAWGEVEGILHSDELPGYGVTKEEVEAVKGRLKASERDAFILVADTLERAVEAIEAVRRRAADATELVPEETRAPLPDGTTSYMRPRPGSARMYPETDIPPFTVRRELLEELRAHLPPTLEQIADELSRRYRLSQQLVSALIDMERVDEFERIVALGITPSFAASFLTDTYKQLRREGYKVDEVGFGKIEELFAMIAKGIIAKESAKEVLAYLSKNPTTTVKEAVEVLGLKAPPLEEVVSTIDRLIAESQLSGRDVTGPIMGELMRIYRGRVDGALLNKLLRERIKVHQRGQET